MDDLVDVPRLLAEHDAGQGGDAPPHQAAVVKPMERLRELLPDVEALNDIPRVQAALELEIMDLREEISVLKAELQRDQEPERMQLIQNLIGELITQITLIREKASEAEAIVTGITGDIQRLDVAKRNLTGTMTAAKRWSMFIQAHEQLKELLETKQYRAMANSLAAVTQLSGPLKPLAANPPVAQLFKESAEYQARIKDTVSAELEGYFVPDPNHPPDAEVVKQACLVVDVLGADYRNHIIERYVGLELRDYRRIFSTGEAAQLDNTARRYAWFRRLIKTFDEEKGGIFPETWELPRVLTAKFIENTRADLTNALAKNKPAVSVLLESWQATSEWEGTIARRFGMPIREIGKDLPMLAQSDAAGQTLSELFEPYFSVFVEAQDRALADMLSAYRGNKSRTSLEGTQENETITTVLPSSTELFYFYGQTLDQCARYTTGKGMSDLAAVFRKWLKVYSDDVLIAAMKPSPARQDGRRSTEGRPNLQEVRNACLTLNTADYCMTTGAQLEDKLKGLVDEAYQEKVSLAAEREQFVGVVSACLVVLLRELESSCEPSLAAILRTPWLNIENVSGRSAYVVDLVGSIKSVAEVVRERIELKKYVRSFADKAVGVVMTRFTGAVVKSRPLKTVGAEQILLDVQAVKSCLLDLPDPAGDSSNSSYSKLVLKATGQLETMLKVILAPEDPPEGFVQNYCLLIGDKSFSNFQKILDLKGTPRVGQQKLLDIFLSVTGSQDDLADTSFLTNLDMDPDKQVTSPLSASQNLLMSPPANMSGLLRGEKGASGTATPNRAETPKPFGDFRRLVSFAIRGD